MSRKRKQYKRSVKPDSLYNSKKITQFINKIMIDGKKRLAERIVYDSLKELSAQTKTAEVEAFETVLKNTMPLMEVKSRRVGGSTYQVPVEVKGDRALSLAMRWIVNTARSKKGKTITASLTSELLEAFNNTGATVKKREDTHKMAEANKAFAHFRW